MAISLMNGNFGTEIKKKMNDDIRILFTEYRQKRKGNFNSNIRRISNLDGNDK